MRTWLNKLVVVSLLFASKVHAESHISEVDYKYIAESSLDFPASRVEYERWETMGAAMMYRDHALLVPEVAERRG